MPLAKRIHSVAQQHNDSALSIRVGTALAVTHYYLGEFTRPDKTHRVFQLWQRKVENSSQEVDEQPAVSGT